MRNFFIKAIHITFSAFIFSLTGCGSGGGGGADGGVVRAPVPDFQQISGSFVRSQYTQTLSAPNPESGITYRDTEFNANHGLAQIKADAAYRRGYFGQGVTIAVVEPSFDPRHPDLDGVLVTQTQNIFDRIAPTPTVFSALDDGEGFHGTYVAILAAGRRGGGGGEVILENGEIGDTLIDSHGVAFSASILAIQNRADGVRDALQRATQSTAHIVNNSFSPNIPYNWARRKDADGNYLPGFWLLPSRNALPFFTPILSTEEGVGLRGEFMEFADWLQDKDQIFVWAASNDGWNSRNLNAHACGKNTRTEDGCELGEVINKLEFIRDFDLIRYDHEGSAVATAALSTLWTSATGVSITVRGGKTIYANLNDPGGWASAPLFFENDVENNLIGKWLVVGSVDRQTVISQFSNGCGAAKNWCVVAPGEGIEIGRFQSGTSWAAPIASGALAVLKSRMPEMPMEVVLAALLTSATPLGTRASIDFEAGEEDIPDDIYGWGLINLSAAINLQGTVTLVSVQASSAQSSRLLSGGAVLPSHFANLPANLNGAKAAFGGVGGAYFNAPLEKMIAAESESFALGDAARRMLPSAVGEIRDGALFAARDSENGHILHLGAAAGDWQLRRDFAAADATRFRSAFSDSAAPFFAVTEDLFVLEMRGKGVRPFAAFGGGDAPYRQFGLRWQGGEKVSAIAEAAALSESRTVLGADFGALGGARANSAAGRIGVRGGFGQWRGFADYAVLHSDASAANGLLRGFSDLRAQEWTAGIAAQNVFGADEIRFAYRRPPFLSGRAHFRFVSAEGSFADAFYNKKPQTLAAQNFAADLSGRAADIVSIGYARRLQQKTNFAIAAEHDLTSGNSALSAFLRTRF